MHLVILPCYNGSGDLLVDAHLNIGCQWHTFKSKVVTIQLLFTQGANQRKQTFQQQTRLKQIETVGPVTRSEHNRINECFLTFSISTSVPPICGLSRTWGRQQVRRPLLTASLPTPSSSVGLHCTCRTPTLSSQGSEKTMTMTTILLGIHTSLLDVNCI